MSSFDEMMANMYQVETGIKGHGSGLAGFPRSHDGLEKAIKLAFDEGSCVTFKGEVIFVMRSMQMSMDTAWGHR